MKKVILLATMFIIVLSSCKKDECVINNEYIMCNDTVVGFDVYLFDVPSPVTITSAYAITTCMGVHMDSCALPVVNVLSYYILDNGFCDSLVYYPTSAPYSIHRTYPTYLEVYINNVKTGSFEVSAEGVRNTAYGAPHSTYCYNYTHKVFIRS